MASMKQFWQSVSDRSACRECGYEDVSLQRSHHETRGTFRCPECDGRGTYYRTHKAVADYTHGALETDGVEHREAEP